MRAPALFDSWECTPPVVPPRSLLYALEPVGIGTPMVESLSGYVARLADAHAVSVGDLVGRVLSPLAESPLVSVGQFMKQHRAKSHGFHARASGLNNSGDMTKQWIAALEQATRRTTLRFLTLLPFAGVLSRQQVSREKRAWCAHCYADWREHGAIMYEPLVWAIGLVTCCPRHDHPLSEQCPHCGCQSKLLTVYACPGYCAQCRAWLGSSRAETVSANRQRVTPASDLELWSAQAIGDLLAIAPSLCEASLPAILRTNLRACVDVVAEGNMNALADACQVSWAALRSHIRGHFLPTLTIFVRMGYRLGVPLTTFFVPHPPHATDHWERAQQIVPRERRGPAKRSAEDVHRMLAEAMVEQPTPSLLEIAKRLGYNRTARLYAVDRDLCQQLTAKYRRSGRSHQWKKPKGYRISEHVNLRQVLQEALAQERPPSLNSLAARLGYTNAGYLRQKCPELCAAFGQTYATRERERREAMEQALRDAVLAKPIPSLNQVAQQLGYVSAAPLWRHFPAQCEEFCAQRQDQRGRQIHAIKRQLQDWQSAIPAVSLLDASRRLGLSSTSLKKWCPKESVALSARYIRWRAEASQLRKGQLFAEIQEIIHFLCVHKQYPSVPRVLARLPPTSLKDWKTISDAIKVAKKTVAQP